MDENENERRIETAQKKIAKKKIECVAKFGISFVVLLRFHCYDEALCFVTTVQTFLPFFFSSYFPFSPLEIVQVFLFFIYLSLVDGNYLNLVDCRSKE